MLPEGTEVDPDDLYEDGEKQDREALEAALIARRQRDPHERLGLDLTGSLVVRKTYLVVRQPHDPWLIGPRINAGLDVLRDLFHRGEPYASLRLHIIDHLGDTIAARQAARAGYGVAMGDTPTVHSDLKEGRLIRLFAEVVPAIHPYYVITPALDRMKPAAQTLEAWIIERFRALKGEDVPVAEKERA